MNTNMFAAVARLSDEALLARLETLAGHAREATVEIIVHLAELQTRKAHRGEGPGSLFEYCTRVLRLSEAASSNRIAAASAARAFPLILDLLADGSINLTTVRVLAPCLTAGNHQQALRAAIGRTKEEVKEIRARLAPQPDVAPSIRKLPTPRHEPPRSLAPAAVVASAPEKTTALERNAPVIVVAQLPTPAQRPVVEPVSPERYRVQFTIGKETREKLRRIQDLMRREVPDGDPGVIFDRALTMLLADVERKRFSATTRPKPPKTGRPGSRDIPAHVEREVWKGDGGRCAFVGRKGRCEQRTFLEFHHRHPHAVGGEATVDNISLRCRAHNVYESELVFGPFDPSIVRETPAVYESNVVPDENLFRNRFGSCSRPTPSGASSLPRMLSPSSPSPSPSP